MDREDRFKCPQEPRYPATFNILLIVILKYTNGLVIGDDTPYHTVSLR